jgi:creatinine amidohydrolase/Fe(II)-dependent formamide hydrolase-like protein
MKKPLLLSVVLSSLFPGVAAAVSPGVHDARRLTAPEIASLDRARTVFIVPIGMLEEHGPHLPVGTDSFSVEYRLDRILPALRKAFPDRFFVRLPLEPYGEGGANIIGAIQVHPGTYGIRQATLRSLVADVGGQIAQNGFRWIFVIHGHGAPPHSLAISEACDFVSETFGVTMLNVTSTAWVDPIHVERSAKIARRHYSAKEIEEIGVDIHAGTSETSCFLSSHPQMVRPIRRLPDRSATDFAGLRKIAVAPGWEGYLADPARAKAAYGKEVNDLEIATQVDLMTRALRGEDISTRPRYPDPLLADPTIQQIIRDTLSFEEDFARKLDAFLAKRRQ